MIRIQYPNNRFFPLSRCLRMAGPLALILSLCGPANAAPTVVANPATAGSLAPRLARGEDGTVWLSWLQAAGDEHQLRIAAFRDGTFGAAQTVASGSDWFINWADTPHLFVAANGRMAVHWLQKNGASTYAYDIKLRYSNDHGQTWSAPLTPHRDGTPTEHGFLSFFPHPQGMGMAWLDGRETGGGHSGTMTLRASALSPDGTLRNEQLLDEQVCDCCQTGAALTNRGAVVVYRDRSDDEIRDIYLVRQTGQGWSQPLQVHNDGWKISGCPVNGPQVASLGDEVAVAWYTMADSIPAVHVARSREGITTFDKPYTLARTTPLGRVAIAHHGAYIGVAWVEEPPAAAAGAHSSTAQLQLAWLDTANLHEYRRITIGEVPTGRASGFPALAAIGKQQWLAAWTSREDDQLTIQTAIVSP